MQNGVPVSSAILIKACNHMPVHSSMLALAVPTQNHYSHSSDILESLHCSTNSCDASLRVYVALNIRQ